MALRQMDKDLITLAGNKANDLLNNVLPQLKKLNVWYNESGGASTTIVQADLDGSTQPLLSGLTKAQLDSALNGLTGSLLTDLTSAATALQDLANRFN